MSSKQLKILKKIEETFNVLLNYKNISDAEQRKIKH